MSERISTPTPTPIGGVSQQPRPLRLDSQGKAMVNGWSSPVDGLVKRWASKHAALLEAGSLGQDPFIHGIHRDADERYVVKLADLEVKVFDLAGTEVPVFGPGGGTNDFSYLDTAPAIENALSDVHTFKIAAFDGAWTPTLWAPNVTPTVSTVVGPQGRPAVILKAAASGGGGGLIAEWEHTADLGTNTGKDAPHVPQLAYIYVNAANVPNTAADMVTLRLEIAGLEYATTWDVSAGTVTAPGNGGFSGIEDLGDGWFALWVDSPGNQTTQFRKFWVEIENDSGTVADAEMLVTQPVVQEGSFGPPIEPVQAPYEDSFKALTVADYTFILNRTKVAEMLPDLTTGGSGKVGALEYGEGLLFCRQPLNCARYFLKVTTETPDTYEVATRTRGTQPGDSMDSASQVFQCGDTLPNTTDIMTVLKTNFGVLGTGITVESMTFTLGSANGGPVLYFKGAVNDVINRIEAWCDKSDSAIHAIFGSVDDITDLPLQGVHGLQVAVAGDANSDDDDYYVKFEGKDPTVTVIQDGAWVEDVKSGIQHQFNGNTMPHQLIRMQDDAAGTVTGTPSAVYFEFGPTAWDNRLAGDTETNPDPSFVGRKINDVFFHNNRLGFVSEGNVILSESGAFFNFWRTTITGGVLDSDRIDIAASTTNVTIFQHAVEFDSTLLLFTDRAQFILSGDPFLTPSTAELTAVFHYETFSGSSPLAVGRGVLFPFKKGDSSGMREILRAGELEFTEIDITSQTPNFIEGDVLRVVGTPLEDVAVVLTKTQRSKLFIYKWFWVGNEKVQSAWSEWTFEGADIRDVFFIENRLYMVVQRSDAIYLESIDISTNLTDPGLDWQIRLDRRHTIPVANMTYAAGPDTTTVTLPWPLTGTEVYVDNATGLVLEVISTGVLSGDLTSLSVDAGFNYEFLWQYGDIVLRSARQGGSAVMDGDFIADAAYIEYADSSYFTATVESSQLDGLTVVTEFSPAIDGPMVLDEVVLDSGEFEVPIQQNMRFIEFTLKSSSHLPFKILGTQWLGQFHSRSIPFTG